MRPLHKFNPAEGRRFATQPRGYDSSEIADPLAMTDQLAKLMHSQDFEDRRDAARLIYLLDRALRCPSPVWVCRSRYAIRADGTRWSDQLVTWSAHLTRENAEAWYAFWVKHWADRRADYEMLPVEHLRDVNFNDLVHPNAPIGFDVPL
jgi:hypothetical protein